MEVVLLSCGNEFIVLSPKQRLGLPNELGNAAFLLSNPLKRADKEENPALHRQVNYRRRNIYVFAAFVPRRLDLGHGSVHDTWGRELCWESRPLAKIGSMQEDE